jgi:hypothetical protein
MIASIEGALMLARVDRDAAPLDHVEAVLLDLVASPRPEISSRETRPSSTRSRCRAAGGDDRALRRPHGLTDADRGPASTRRRATTRDDHLHDIDGDGCSFACRFGCESVTHRSKTPAI